MATHILFFGKLREAIGAGERIADLPPGVADVAALIDWIADGDERIKDALSAPSVRIAVDQRLAAPEEKFAAPREIAFMPPFSGG